MKINRKYLEKFTTKPPYQQMKIMPSDICLCICNSQDLIGAQRYY